MSKLVIILCVMLVASAPNILSLNYGSTVERAVIATNSVITEIKDTMLAVNEEGTEEFDRLLNKTYQIMGNNTAQIIELQLKVNSDLEKLYSNAGGVDISNCITLSDNIDNTTDVAISNTNACINGKLKTAIGYIEEINIISESGLAIVAKLTGESGICFSRLSKTSEIILCLELVAAKVFQMYGKIYPKMRIRIDWISEMLQTAEPTLAHCVIPERKNLQEKLSNITVEIKKCIQQRVNEGSTTNAKCNNSNISGGSDGVSPYIWAPRVG